MQTYLQYRRIGQAVRRQLDEHPEWASTTQRRRNEITVNDQKNENAQEKPSRLRPFSLPPGVRQKEILDSDGAPATVFVVGWDDENDPVNPHNYSMARRISATLIVSALSFVVGAASSIESAVLPQNGAAFGVSEVVASLATAMYLLGFAIGSLASGPLSEILGRNALAFRFLAGVFGCPPLTCAGPVFGPAIASYMGQGTLSWRWTNWIMLIMSGLIIALILLFQPEPYVTGDRRYQSEMDMEKITLFSRITTACVRQFTLTVHEPIILFIVLYMTIIYIVLFTFFDGYPFIFQEVYEISQGLTNIVWVVTYVGIALASLEFAATTASTTAPSSITQSDETTSDDESTKKSHPRDPRIGFDYKSISIWSPIIASAVFGFGTITVFISSYMYINDSYDKYAASALGFMAVSRYCAAGGMTVVGIPFYSNMGVHYTLTILACISVVMMPLPYVFWKFGHIIRGWSKFAVNA
ncbi:major facilitator superfamily domain-containing protein [Aspergillus spectabilis]